MLTNDDKTILAPGNAHIDLMLISDEAKMFIQPLVVCLHIVLIPDLFFTLCAHSRQNDNPILIALISEYN